MKAIARWSRFERWLLGALFAGLFVPSLLLLAMAVYYTQIDTVPPSRVIYQHPLFTQIPVATREEAERWQITEGHPGQTVYRYQEYCLDRPALGIVRRQWVDSVVWPVSDKRNIGEVGCRQLSVAETLPPYASRTEVRFQMRIDYPGANPLRVLTVQYADIPIWIVP